ncbi:site-specific integrase [Acidithiobacillus montserratensis]|uniref:Site-specific integrase n=1 Tax=Acidithiobacillus montserratensis TaxID=2729135 RepID=A0ACD5HE53_9PROT
MIRKQGFPSQTKTFRTKAEAQDWAKVTEAEMAKGTWRDRREAESTTLSEALDRYAREVSGLKKGTAQELSIIAKLKTSPLAPLYLGAIQGKHVANYRDELLAEGYKPATIKRRLAILSHLYVIADKEWGIDGLVNPVPRVTVKTGNNARDRRLQPGEEQRLLEAAEEYRGGLPLIIRFALETAMRRGEIAAMRWAHIESGGRVLRVPDSKNGESRMVPLSTVAAGILQGLPRRIDGKVWGIRADSITQAFDRACNRAGIEDLRFHDLRHEATSRLFEKGLNPMQVASITGHKTLQMLKRYTHLRAEDLAKILG